MININIHEVIQKIITLSNIDELNTKEIVNNLQEINVLISSVTPDKPEMNIIQLTDLELKIVESVIEVVGDLPCGFEAIDGYVDLDDETWDAIQTLKQKI